MSKQQSPKKKRFIRIIIIEAVLVIIILAAAQLYRSFNKTLDKININNVDDANIKQNEGVVNEGYRNIVIFGLDTRNNALDRGNSDTIMVASINNRTKDVRLVSIYRDTYVSIPDIGCRKINAAYANGGYSLALTTINMNFDLDITEYITVNFRAVVETIDQLGGITLDIQKNELQTLNGYVRELNRINGTDVPGLAAAGTQTVNGTQATAYSRIRYTEGGDYKRTERQRIVLGKIFEKIKKSKLTTIYDLINDIFPQTATNLSKDEIIDLSKSVFSYDIVDQTGFPFEKDSHTYNRVSYVFPIGLADNVVRLHQFLFEKEAYTPSSKVQEISDYVEDIRQR
jgi:LCP family protein required for cell wall assembly